MGAGWYAEPRMRGGQQTSSQPGGCGGGAPPSPFWCSLCCWRVQSPGFSGTCQNSKPKVRVHSTAELAGAAWLSPCFLPVCVVPLAVSCLGASMQLWWNPVKHLDRAWNSLLPCVTSGCLVCEGCQGSWWAISRAFVTCFPPWRQTDRLREISRVLVYSPNTHSTQGCGARNSIQVSHVGNRDPDTGTVMLLLRAHIRRS